MTITILRTIKDLTDEQVKEIDLQGTIIDDTHYNITITGSKYNIESLCMYFDNEEITWCYI